MRSFFRVVLLTLTILFFLRTNAAFAQSNQSFLVFEIKGMKSPTHCELLWWDDEYSIGFTTHVEVTQGADVWYGAALRPEELKEKILSYGLTCEAEGEVKPVAISNGRTLTNREIAKLSEQRKDIVTDIQSIRKEKEKLQDETKTSRTQLLSLIPTDEIITLRQEVSSIEKENQMLSSEKKILDGALLNLDFKKQQSDVFFASEQQLQQYLEEQRIHAVKTNKKSAK